MKTLKNTCNEKGEEIYMTRKEFQEFIAKGKMILDGATGSNLQKRGMPTGVCPEEWILLWRHICLRSRDIM